MRKIHVMDAVKIVFRIDFAAAGLFFILNLFMAVVPSLQTLVIADFVDQVMALGSADTQNRKVLLLIFFLVALVAYSWISKSLTELVGQHIEMRLRAIFKPWLVEKISRLKYEAMENESIRDKISRINTNAEVQVREAYSCLLRLLGLILKVAGILVIMLSQVWWLAFLLLIVSIPCFRIAMKSGKEDYEAQADVTKVSRVNEYYNEMLKKREYVDERTLFGYQQEYRDKFLHQYEKARNYTTGVRLKWFIKTKAGSMAVILVSAFSLAVMIPLTLDGRLSFGMFMALVNAVFGIVQNMSWDLTYCIDRNAWYNQYFQELEEIFAMEEEQGVAEHEGMEKTKKKVSEFRTLEFRNVNGLYQEYEGKILINGEDIRNYDRDFLSNVFQDFARYPISVRENITIGRKDGVSEEELTAVMDEIGMRQTVDKLKDGVNTVLGKIKEDSQDISGGEWQKIALARCALSKAPISILDEPTAAMDPVYESKIYRNFQQISRGKTVLLISHRLASVKMADIIFVIKDGMVSETGSHSQLMAKGGLYKRMYEEQAKWYEEDRKGVNTVYES